MDGLKEETVSVSGRSGAQSSVASVLDVRVQSDFTSPFAHSGSVQFLESREGCSNEGYSIRLCCTQVISEAPAVFNMIV